MINISPLLINKTIPQDKIRTAIKTVSITPGHGVNLFLDQSSANDKMRMNAASFSIIPNFVKNGYDKFIGFVAKGVGKLADADWMQKLTKKCVEKNINYTAHLSALCANILNAFYMYNVSRSQKIEQEQKGPLMLNMFIGTLFSTAGGYLINGMIDKKLKPIDEAIKKHFKEKTPIIQDGFKVAKSLMVFQLLYRFVSPVIATPIANHISNKIREKKEGDKGNLTI